LKYQYQLNTSDGLRIVFWTIGTFCASLCERTDRWTRWQMIKRELES